MDRKKFLNSLFSISSLLYINPAKVFSNIRYNQNEQINNEIEKVHVIFKTHLDIGFTDLAENVVERYFKSFIPSALSLAEEIREEKLKENFVWTTGSWLIYEFLERATKGERIRMEDAINNGDIVWHGLPFTMHSELMDKSLFSLSTRLAAELDKRFGKTTIAAKMTDVPSHSIGIVPVLQKADIKFLHIGINPASTPSELPPLFRWLAPDNSEIIVMYQMDYGSIMIIPNTKVAVAINFTGDNHGPQSIEAIKNTYGNLKKKFPNAQLVGSNLNSVASDVEKIRSSLPIVKQELGDTWIHGVGSDPWKIARYRELCRIRNEWIAKGFIKHGDIQDLKFGIPLMMIAEHTWGLDVKTHLKDWDIYRHNDFDKARTKDNFKLMEKSWNEKRAYIDKAIDSLPNTLKQQALISLKNNEPVIPDTKTYTNLNDCKITTENFDVEFDSNTGAIIKLENSKTGIIWADKNSTIGLLAYQLFSKEDYDRFQDQYLTQKPYWAIADFGKPGIEKLGIKSKTYFSKVAEILKKNDEGNETVIIKSEIQINDNNKNFVTNSAGIFITKYIFKNTSSIEIELQWFDKPANRLPEALWFSFIPKVSSGSWYLDKMGLDIDPKDIVKNGNRKLHGIIDSVKYKDDRTFFQIKSLDAALVAPSERSLLNFNNKLPEVDKGMHFCLYNNVWGTNFMMWFEDNMKYRFTLTV
ncbi:MAG: DUF5054 domain-containing protein [Ignavibacteriales bacterium]|nr:DUF5054 domain-containing protein [Ignavibacteriales bacterium]MCB9210420.1 DUF5054 domain-containing protein [Ignavibacteriales bacterium]MCB9220113.1 DUF5054 domain-containing protein [Ignavibacteriales bacterium]